MKTVRKIITSVLAATLLIICFASCSGDVGDDGKFTVVTTVFPAYDWVRQIAGDAEGIEIVYLLDNGVDMHNYKPTAKDITKISTCDLFIYVGGASDEWTENVLADASNKNMAVINMMETLGTDALSNAACTLEDHSDHDHVHDHGEESYDEHVWLSLEFSVDLCEKIGEAMCAADPGNAEKYEAGLEAYLRELGTLQAEYAAVTANADHDTLIFCDRFPFIYLTRELGLSYIAALPGCSTESSVSFDTVLALAEGIDNTGVTRVLKIEGSDSSIADSVISTAKTEGIEVLTLNSLQSVTAKAAEAGTTYITVMRENLAVIAEALGQSRN